MSEIPEEYKFLLNEPVPPLVREALKLYGTEEIEGDISSPEIISWAEELKIENYTKTRAWCGLFMSLIATRAGYEIPTDSLRSLSWIAFGERVEFPMIGDILIFKRIRGGHIGLYVGEDETHYHVLGGNQRKNGKDSVNIKRLKKDKVVDIRMPFPKEKHYEIIN